MWAASSRGNRQRGRPHNTSLDVVVTPLVLAIITSVAVLNAFACVAVARSENYERRQKLLQFVVIWLVPLLGALLSFALVREPKTSRFETDMSNPYTPDDGNLRLGTTSHDHLGESGGDSH